MTFDPSKFKEGLLQPIDMNAFRIETLGRTIVPYAGESVWMEPYIDAEAELRLAEARDALQRRQDEVQRLKDAGEQVPDDLRVGMDENLRMIAEVLAEYTLGWDLTDKYGEPLGQPASAEAFLKLPSRALLFLMNEALGVESKDDEVKDSAA